MKWNEQELKLINKAEFYRKNNITAHVLIIPKPKFKNGVFSSELQEDKFWWFMENNSSIPLRLFLFEVYDILDYQEKGEGE